MAQTTTQRLMELGVPFVMASELMKQVNSGSYNWQRLINAGWVTELAQYFAKSLAAGNYKATKAVEYGCVPAIATLIAGVGGQQPLRIAGTGGEVPQQTVAAGNASQVRIEADSVMKLGRAQRSLAVAFSNFTLNGNRVETDVANAVVVRAHVRIDGAPAPVAVLTFDGGQTSRSMAAGEALAVSDEVLAAAFGLTEFAAGTVAMVRVSMTVATTGEVIPTTRAKYTAGGEQAVRGPSTSSQIGSAGALTTPGGWAVVTNKVAPVALLGRAVQAGAVSAIFFGDSLVDGFKDSVGYGDNGGGFYPRAAWNIGGGAVLPWARQAKTGTTAQQAAASFAKQSALWRYATHFIDNIGTNDASFLRTPPQVIADKKTTADFAKSQGCKVVWQRIMTRASGSSDGYATVAGQTIGTAFQNGGTFRDPINLLIAAELSNGYLAAVLTTDEGWRDSIQTDHIAAPGVTDDGTHSLPPAAANIAGPLSPQFAALAA